MVREPKQKKKKKRATYLGENDSHGQLLTVRCHISQHHDPGQPQASAALAEVGDHFGRAATIDDYLGQLRKKKQNGDVLYSVRDLVSVLERLCVH